MRTTTDTHTTLRGAHIGTLLVLARAVHLAESGRGRPVIEHTCFEVVGREASRGVKGTTILSLKALSGGRGAEREELLIDCKAIPADIRGAAVFFMPALFESPVNTAQTATPVPSKPRKVKGKLPNDEVTQLVAEVAQTVDLSPPTLEVVSSGGLSEEPAPLVEEV